MPFLPSKAVSIDQPLLHFLRMAWDFLLINPIISPEPLDSGCLLLDVCRDADLPGQIKPSITFNTFLLHSTAKKASRPPRQPPPEESEPITYKCAVAD